MMALPTCSRRAIARGRWRPGLSLVEVTLSVLILSIVAVAAARTVVGARAADQLAVDREQARQLAESMLSRIMVLSYEDPSPGLLGIDLGETLGLTSTYDDIDDFDGYKESPVLDSTGAPIAGLSSWSRSVQVVWVKPDDFTATRGSETGVKRVRVQVSKGSRLILEAYAYRSKSRDRMGG